MNLQRTLLSEKKPGTKQDGVTPLTKLQKRRSTVPRTVKWLPWLGPKVEGINCRKYNGTFSSNGKVIYIDCDGSCTTIYLFQNSNYAL